ncbi:hypothetical protein BD324DRAFT_651025 [Kockovaella imperatae]|uniref:Uncharacterized protein n=1 Tax=Kockovaella imperatae TaxID=4999 RepID=A0A1Y1UHC4_9TREE|nr:hypothetical protein BD324DRAFT_651025 [Kockovaella imperatae]ORX37432.1 hypothetical protein BD324DRAFT_651025 [Kockovaella imperatae]
MLPYEGTPPPDEHPTLGVETSEAQSTDPLDRPLDDYRAEVPDHVKSLMGRMSRGKVYLLEETPAIIHVDGEERVRRDPRIAELAAQLDTHDPTAWLAAVSESVRSPIRPNALFIRSDVIKHLSTSKVFSWTTSLGAGVMGIEWLNDTTLILLFPTPAAALLALTLLSKAGFDPTEGDDPLLERSAHTVPIHLLPQAELDPTDSKAGTELLASSQPEDSSAPRRRGRGTFASSQSGSDRPLLASDEMANEWNLAPGVDANARITVRFAVESDSELRREAKMSEWYQRHGRRAGKETATGARRSMGREDDAQLTWQGRDSGEGREFAKRISRERRDPYSRPSGNDRARGRGRRTAEDLDKELEGFARRRNGQDGDETMDLDADLNGSGDGRRQRRDRRGKEDLDSELDSMFAARNPAPA